MEEHAKDDPTTSSSRKEGSPPRLNDLSDIPPRKSRRFKPQPLTNPGDVMRLVQECKAATGREKLTKANLISKSAPLCSIIHDYLFLLTECGDVGYGPYNRFVRRANAKGLHPDTLPALASYFSEEQALEMDIDKTQHQSSFVDLSEADFSDRRKYLTNRASLNPAELERYAGQWIAWSPDGSRIVGHANDLVALEEILANSGEDPRRCVIEGVSEEETLFCDGSVETD